jgi:protein arginine N-methyltransferase 1
MNQDNDTQRELVGDEKQVSKLDGQAPESTDFANYFCTYSYLYHQKDMLEDHKRTGAYFDA